MVRKLKYHEQKLLKKVDFINWEVDNNLHEVKVLRKYHIEKREDYTKWVCVCVCVIESDQRKLNNSLFKDEEILSMIQEKIAE